MTRKKLTRSKLRRIIHEEKRKMQGSSQEDELRRAIREEIRRLDEENGLPENLVGKAQDIGFTEAGSGDLRYTTVQQPAYSLEVAPNTNLLFGLSEGVDPAVFLEFGDGANAGWYERDIQTVLTKGAVKDISKVLQAEMEKVDATHPTQLGTEAASRIGSYIENQYDPTQIRYPEASVSGISY